MVAEQNARLDEEVKNIEAAYYPRRYYDFTYFKSKTKGTVAEYRYGFAENIPRKTEKFLKIFKKFEGREPANLFAKHSFCE